MSESSLLNSALGKIIARVRRAHYLYRGSIDSETGPLELTFDSGVLLLLDAGGDGESLAVKAEAWSDAFREPLSDENLRYVEEYGKWAAFDVSAQEPFRRLLGRRIQRIDEVVTPFGKITGVRFQCDGVAVVAVVESDELVVHVG